MAIVYRNGRPYLYKSLRRGAQVTSRYLAKGEDALLINAIETMARDEWDCERCWDEQMREESNDLERALDEMSERARTLAGEVLISAGYYQHHRGEWRKRRGNRSAKSQAE
jgi:hypothetical protein